MKIFKKIDQWLWRQICKFVNSKPIYFFSYMLGGSVFSLGIFNLIGITLLNKTLQNIQEFCIVGITVSSCLLTYNFITKKICKVDFLDVFKEKSTNTIVEPKVEVDKNELMFSQEALEKELNHNKEMNS